MLLVSAAAVLALGGVFIVVSKLKEQVRESDAVIAKLLDRL
jgi:hypothetical protein